MADLYISLSRTADILGEPVAVIDCLRNDPAHGFPRKYNFDAAAKDGRLAIKRGPYFRFDEINAWAEATADQCRSRWRARSSSRSKIST